MRISKPQHDKSANRWNIRWTSDDGGKRCSKGFATKDEAESFRSELKGPSGQDEIELPPFESGASAGSSTWWSDVLAWLARCLQVVTNSEDEDRIETVCKVARATSQLATASKNHMDLEKLEQTLKRLEARDAELTAARKHATRFSINPPIPKEACNA